MNRLVGTHHKGVLIKRFVSGKRIGGKQMIAPTFECVCSCGNDFVGYVSTVYAGDAISCGCRKPENRYLGKMYNGLKVMEYISVSGKEPRFRCECICGIQFVANAAKIRSGHTKSCGCRKGELMIASKGQDGRARTKEYMIYKSIQNRCYNENDASYAKYGARRIKMSDEWRNSFDVFLADMGPKPFPEASIDRINPYGNYCKENCRWATDKVQRANQIPPWSNIMTAMRYGFYLVGEPTINVAIRL